jgi:hypothetical protein
MRSGARKINALTNSVRLFWNTGLVKNSGLMAHTLVFKYATTFAIKCLDFKKHLVKAKRKTRKNDRRGR